MGLSQSHDQGCKVDKLTQVKSGYFSYFIFIRFSRSHDIRHRFGELTRFVLLCFFLIDLFF
jgi:hypothetical protein